MTCACGNAARYINERGEFACGICPIKEGVDSIRIADVPALLEWVRVYLKEGAAADFDYPARVRWLRTIVGRGPGEVGGLSVDGRWLRMHAQSIGIMERK